MRLLPVILFITVCGPLLAQGDLDTQEKIFWRNERSIGPALNSDGWSLIYRELRQTKPSNRFFLEGGVSTFKHPKEIKLSNYLFPNPGTFVFGKLNSTWALRAGAGFQKELFEKRDLGGVSISWFVGGGPVVTFAKPIYYKVIVLVSTNYYTIEEQKFGPTIHQPEDIMSKSSFFKGFDEMKLYPGVYGHGGFSFEYSKNDKVTHAIELGGSVNAFMQEIPIMTSEDNKQVFLSLFVSYRIGMILDPLNPGSFFKTVFNRREE